MFLTDTHTQRCNIILLFVLLFSYSPFHTHPFMLTWYHTGTMLVVPGASYRADSAAEAIHASYVFAHGSWNTPAMVLPAVHKVRDRCIATC